MTFRKNELKKGSKDLRGIWHLVEVKTGIEVNLNINPNTMYSIMTVWCTNLH